MEGKRPSFVDFYCRAGYSARMRRWVVGGLAVSMFLFMLGLPFLHLHPAGQEDHGHLAVYHHQAIVHTHIPSGTAGDSRAGTTGSIGGPDDPDESDALPLDFAALHFAPCSHHLPSALLVAVLSPPKPEYPAGFLFTPSPEAQPPPAFLKTRSLRGPPA